MAEDCNSNGCHSNNNNNDPLQKRLRVDNNNNVDTNHDDKIKEIINTNESKKTKTTTRIVNKEQKY